MLENPFYYNEDAKHQRCFMRRVILALLLGAFIFASVIYWGVGRADTTTMVYKDSRATLTLFRKPCETPEVLKVLEPDERAKYQAATLIYLGRSLRSCWLLKPDGGVTSMDEEGDRLYPDIPMTLFKMDSGV